MAEAAEEILKIIKENAGILIGSDVCAHCFSNDISDCKFILVKLDWRSGGKDYKSVGLFICKKCGAAPIDQKKLLQNLLYMLEEFHKEVI